jgi:Fe-S cluster biogenesis protein NfuA
MCAAAGSTLRGFVEAKLRELVEPDVNVVEARETAEAGGAGGVKEADGGSVS